MPDWVAIVVLGIIEGITEFLPVSSTGHLLLAQGWLERHQTDLFNVVIQCGAVMAVLIIFTERLRQLVFHWRQPASRDFLLKLGLAFCITGVGGLILKKLDFKLPEEPAPVAWATLIGGVLILVIERLLRGRALSNEITWTIALAAGLAQLVAAVFPGTSRSGITILTTLAMGLNRPAAAEFSFMLGIPTLLSAGALQLVSALREPSAEPINWSWLILGTTVATITAFLAVKWLLKFIQTHTFVLFGWYRIALGAAILAVAR